LPGEEVVLRLDGPTDGVAPYEVQLTVRGPHMKASRVLVFDTPPFDDGAACTPLEVKGDDAIVFVPPQATRYVVIDTVEATSPDDEISIGKTCSRCGNGRVDDNELCDDANLSDGDGCSSTCEREEGWYCQSQEARAQSRCTLAAGCEDAVVVAPGLVSFAPHSNYAQSGDFGECAPSTRDRVEFQVIVPAGQTLTLEGEGETRITSACKDHSTCLGERSYTNTDDEPRAVWVHAWAATGHEGYLTIQLN
jgi:cysteine-rich repeat protein